MTSSAVELSTDRWRAAIFDLDGVVTRTAAVHAGAWKRMFDEFLSTRTQRPGEDLSPFDPERDYRRWVDGKPRYDGVASFLASRGIDLPRGEPTDPPDRETVCGLGNRKNELFHELLHDSGVDVFPAAVTLLERLRECGVATAVVSSSKNTRAVLEAAGIGPLFDACVDGVETERLGLAGKPAPDVFIEAASRLDAPPAASIVLEDAVAGVEAGRAGDFGMVVGIDRTGSSGDRLREAGADLVVSDLAGFVVTGPTDDRGGADRLPSALDAVDEILGRSRGEPPIAVFLDYDGTLTPIVRRPEDARLDGPMRDALVALAEVCPVAVISGRDLEDVRRMVGVPSIHYAGSHGFDIAGPEVVAQHGTEFLDDLEASEQELEDALEEIAGAWVERKRFSVAVHFREAAADRIDDVREAVGAVHERRRDRLRLSEGKKILELRPAIDWDKGKALSWLLTELGLDRAGTMPLYIGDDTTDEDAFREIRDRGVGIVVGERPEPTAASYRLDDPDEVRRLLVRITRALQGGSR